ncbi:MAG TPA: acyl-CoA thioesterase/bile acid-CoA:amino acid N-acyltransferase family protein [Candidatus Binatia bacterium]|jgi:dienelactone hydrolase|nr:acyl-CoA thioesterase/bile acid-CoA:amino acid N-acyltransferase family protein [Candidatus Binatia bacterium]
MSNTTHEQTGPRIEVHPVKALIDEPVAIRLSGFGANQRATLRARMGQNWAAHASFLTDAQGVADIGTQQPLDGTYDRADPMGLFWSMALPPDVEFQPSAMPALSPHASLVVRFEAEVEGAPVASVQVERQLMAPDVTRQEIRQDGIVATFFRPPGAGPHPTVMVVSSSDGGVPEAQAALFASHGFTALALAYLGIPPFPPTLVEIPLEYFGSALQWLAKQEGVNPHAIAVTGASKGGELALLLGATFPEIRAVVAYTPSGVLWQGQQVMGVQPAEPRAAWTLDGKPLPFLRYPTPPSARHTPRTATAPSLLAALRDVEAVEHATIPVERTRGPILLITGQDDPLWPAELAEIAIRRLAKQRFPFPVEHLSYPGAGHLIFFPPYGPTTIRFLRHPVLKRTFHYGGTTAGDAFARADSWPKVLAFLRRSLEQEDGNSEPREGVP